MNASSIAFVGGGNMAGSLVGGLLARGWGATSIRVSDPEEASLARLAHLGVATFNDNAAAVSGADIVVLAVKPQMMRNACLDIREAVGVDRPLVISIAAGTAITSIATWLGEDTAVVRCMPNTPAMLQCGATVLFANAHVRPEQRRVAHEVLESVGYAAWVDREELLHELEAELASLSDLAKVSHTKRVCALRTSARVSARTEGLFCSTRLTVDFEIPACFATSIMVSLIK